MAVVAPSDPFQGIRLAQFRVEKLFDEFDYVIPLHVDQHVTAIIAPNGTGKTLCLRMIHALFDQKWGVFFDTSFSSAVFEFTDKTVIRIFKSKQRPRQDSADDPESLHLTIRSPNLNSEIEWKPKAVDPKQASLHIERFIPFVSRVSIGKWRHDHTGELYSFTDLIDQYGDTIPDEIKEMAYRDKPIELGMITKQVECRLIETQRLLILRDDDRDDFFHPNRHPRSTLAITRKAQTLKDIISREINAYAALSQSLDRTFPKRVISSPASFPAEDLKSRLDELDAKRKELMAAGILDTEADDSVSIPDGEIEPAIARVLNFYAIDSKKKLDSLSPILAKITLFKKLIDQRFVTKDVRISKQNGIDVQFKGNRVALSRLSSGEQHQLVLFFELLFEIKENSLILIDEPELSLHVAWQKKFIGDLMKIIELNRFDVILATHSPQLIGRWNNLVVELGDVEGEAEDDNVTGVR